MPDDEFLIFPIVKRPGLSALFFDNADLVRVDDQLMFEDFGLFVFNLAKILAFPVRITYYEPKCEKASIRRRQT